MVLTKVKETGETFTCKNLYYDACRNCQLAFLNATHIECNHLLLEFILYMSASISLNTSFILSMSASISE